MLDRTEIGGRAEKILGSMAAIKEKSGGERNSRSSVEKYSYK